MPLLATEAAKLSQELLVRGVIEEIIDRDELFALIPFTQVNNKAYLYHRENTIDEGDFITVGDTVPEGAATFNEIIAKLKILAGDVDVDNFLQETQSDHNDQTAIQIAQKAKGLGRKFRRALAAGDSTANPKSFDGLPTFATSAQTLIAGANGAAVTASMLDELKDAVKHGADALVMRPGTWRAIKALLRAMGGNEAEMVMVENFGHPIPAFDGTPVLRNEFLSNTEVMGSSSATCSIYAIRLNEADGFHGIYGGQTAGIRYVPVGQKESQDATRHRLKWYTATVLKSTQSLARLKGITNI